MKHKFLLAAGLLAIQAIVSPFAIAKPSQGQPAGTIQGYVVPDQVGANQPFTFAATKVVEGEVVSVKTVSGEVVATKKTDKLGRVFLPAGLAAGAYLLTTRAGKPTGHLNVGPGSLPFGNTLCVTSAPSAIDVSQGLCLTGTGMNPNAANMSAIIGKTEFPVLAGTATEMKTGPLPSSACNNGPVEVKNTQTNETSQLDNVVFYELSAKMARQKITGGEQTTLEFTFKPANFNASVNARIISGPVSFQGGAKEKDFMVEKGTGKLPLVADPAGLGQFRVAYDINEILGAGKLAGSTFQPLKPGGPVGGEKPEKVDNKKKQCPKTIHMRDEANGWQQSEKKVKDAEGKEKTIYVISRTVRCSIYKSCSKLEGHGGNCNFAGKSRCEVHDIVETREFDNERDRKDSMKDTGIPEKIKFPG
ncbi:MAG: hypothetical protein H7Y17_17135 [Chlorobia bacterium]|nr:hypothetical protein [Fimbriimonadaceae bacterium]